MRDLVDHIDYAVRLIGVDHVGISSDFGGGGGIVGWQDASETRNVTAELEARGYCASRHREDLERQPAARVARASSQRTRRRATTRSARDAATVSGAIFDCAGTRQVLVWRSASATRPVRSSFVG